MLDVVDLNYHCVTFFVCVCVFTLFEGISLHDPLLLYGECEPEKIRSFYPVSFRVFLDFRSKVVGSLDFCLIYLKNCFYLFVSFLQLSIVSLFFLLNIRFQCVCICM